MRVKKADNINEVVGVIGKIAGKTLGKIATRVGEKAATKVAEKTAEKAAERHGLSRLSELCLCIVESMHSR